MPSRRDFLTTLTGLTATWPALAQGHPNPDDEEAFWRQVRGQFPLRPERVYFNNGTNGPSPWAVVRAQQALMDELERTGEYGSPEPARQALAGFFNVAASTISLTHNTTEAINHLAWGLPLRRGDEVVLTDHEHAGNALPWLHRAKRTGLRLRVLALAPTAAETLNRLEGLLNRRTRVLALPHITCTTGQVLPLAQLAALAQTKNLWLAVDGAHGPGSLPLDLGQLGRVFYAGCGHKWLLGPKGTGFLYVPPALLDVLQPLHLGAHADAGWTLTPQSQQLTGYAPTAHRYDYGTQNAATYAGLVAAVDFLTRLGLDRVAARGQQLAARLQAGLLALPHRAQVLTPTEPASRGNMVTFRPLGQDYQALNERATRQGFRLRVVPEHGLNAVRVSTHLYNQPSEVDRLLELVATV
jgi:cysteine desulfurase / selenocysteine lyase